MGCGCKKGAEIEDKYGRADEETLIESFIRYAYKFSIFLVAVALGAVIAPIMITIGLYKAMFMRGKPMVLPSFLRKYVKTSDEQELQNKH